MHKISQQIQNMAEPFNDVQQIATIISYKIDFPLHGDSNPLLPQIIIQYQVLMTKNDIDVTNKHKNLTQPLVFNNQFKIIKRSFEDDTFFEPILNENFIEGESPESERYETAPAFDFIYGVLLGEYPHKWKEAMQMYITENANDGLFNELI